MDCLGWVRDDSIVIGWKGFNEGNGEYMVQVIRSEKTTFVKVSWSFRFGWLLCLILYYIACFDFLAIDNGRDMFM